MPPTPPEDEAFEPNDNPAEESAEMPEGGMTPGELCVPLAALSEPDEQDQMTPPAEGDKGQANVEYTVNRIDGENAYVTLDAVNGQKLDQAADAPQGDDQEMVSLQQMATQQPERY